MSTFLPIILHISILNFKVLFSYTIYPPAAAAAKSLQSCPTLCDPIDGSPPGSPVPGILQARTLQWVAISFSNAWKWKVKVKLLSRPTLSDPVVCSPPGSSIHGIFRARTLEWGRLPSPVSPPRTCLTRLSQPCSAAGIFGFSGCRWVFWLPPLFLSGNREGLRGVPPRTWDHFFPSWSDAFLGSYLRNFYL